MTQSTLPTITVPFSLINQLAFQLRQAGAKFNVISQGETCSLNFRILPDTAQSILTNFRVQSQEQISEASDSPVVINEIREEINPVSEAIIPETQVEINPVSEVIIPETQVEINPVSEVIMTENHELINPISEVIIPETQEQFATFDQLIMLERKTLRALAKDLNIQGRSKMDIEDLAKVLANQVPVSSL